MSPHTIRDEPMRCCARRRRDEKAVPCLAAAAGDVRARRTTSSSNPGRAARSFPSVPALAVGCVSSILLLAAGGLSPHRSCSVRSVATAFQPIPSPRFAFAAKIIRDHPSSSSALIGLDTIARLPIYSRNNKSHAHRSDRPTPHLFQTRATETSQETDDAEVIIATDAPPEPTESVRSFALALETGSESESEPARSDDPNYLPIMALCFLVACLSALDRVAMSVAILPLSSELHLTETVKGQISSIFSVGYGLAILPCGLLVAALSPRLIMAAGVVLWSLATFGTPLAANLVHVREVLPGGDGGVDAAGAAVSTLLVAENVAPLLLVRAVMGAAESVVLPAIQRILANWVPPSKKSLAVAGIFTGFQFGTVTAYLLSPVIIERFGGWRGMFYLYGVLGLLWLVPWLAFAKDGPPGLLLVDAAAAAEHREDEETVLMNTMMEDDVSLVPEHLQPVRVDLVRGMDGGGSAALSTQDMIVEPELPSPSAFEEAVSVLREAPWRGLLTSRAAWGMTIAHAANNWGLYNNLSWTPTFYAEQYGLSVKDSALLSLLPSVAGAVGGLFAGSVADAITERVGGAEEKRTLVRKVFQGLALVGPAACLLTLSKDIPAEPLAAQALLTGTVGLQAFNAAGYGAATQEKAAKWAGLLYSVTSLPGVIFGSVGVYATGQILDRTGDWSVVFGINALVDIVGAAAFIALYNSKKEFD